jgi:hypothetical protein
VAALHDQQDLPVPESVDPLVGPADVGHDRQAVGLLVQQDRIVRRDQFAGVAAHQCRPRVIPDQVPDDVGVVAEVVGVGAHGLDCSRRRAPTTDPYGNRRRPLRQPIADPYGNRPDQRTDPAAAATSATSAASANTNVISRWRLTVPSWLPSRL